MPAYTARTLGELVVRLAEYVGDLVTFGTATAGAAGTVTANATTCPSITSNDARYLGKWFYMFAGTSAGDPRRISAYSTGRVITVSQNFSSTPTTSSQFAILNRFDPRLLERAILRAEEYQTDAGISLRPVTGRELVAGSALPNVPDLFTTANVPDGLTLDSTSTFTSQTDPTLGGRRVLRMVTDGTNVGFIRYSIPGWGQWQGKTAYLYAHLRSSIVASSRVGVQINDGITTATNSYLSTIRDWQLLQPTQAMGDAATQLRMSIEATAGAAVTVELALWYAPYPFGPPWSHPLDADRNLVAISGLRFSAGKVSTTFPRVHAFPYRIEPDAFDIFEDADDTPRQLRLHVDDRWKGHVLEYKGWQRHAELTAGSATTSYTGNPNLILPRAKYFLLQAVGAPAADIDRAEREAELAERRFGVELDGAKRVVGF
jgi:hypothetical protein